MLHTNFKDYNEFKELYVREDGKRKNAVLLAFTTSKELFKWYQKRQRLDLFFKIRSMNDLFQELLTRITNTSYGDYSIEIDGWRFHSDIYRMDGQKGLCFDGDVESFRYVRVTDNATYKKKVGRLVGMLIDASEYGQEIPRKCKVWLCEELAQRWRSYAASQINDFELVVDDDFESIYDQDNCYLDGEDMGSCMQNDGYHSFYNDAVDAYAASLRKGGYIVARCVIYNRAKQYGTDKIFRLAERQYAIDCRDLYKRLLVAKLIDKGLIDAYKPAGASCHEPQSWLDVNGEPLSETRFSIECNLEHNDTLSYQDSFKWYDESKHTAFNYRVNGSKESLTETDGYYRSDKYWDSYNEQYADEETITCYRDGYEYTTDRWTIDEYFEWVEDEEAYYYEGDVTFCDCCNKYVLNDNAWYSEKLECYFCSEECMEEAENEEEE